MIYNKWIHLQVHDRRPPCCKLDLLTIDPGLCIDRFLLLLLLLLVLINLAVGKQCSCALLPPSDTTTLKHTPRGGGSETLMWLAEEEGDIWLATYIPLVEKMHLWIGSRQGSLKKIHTQMRRGLQNKSICIWMYQHPHMFWWKLQILFKYNI